MILAFALACGILNHQSTQDALIVSLLKSRRIDDHFYLSLKGDKAGNRICMIKDNRGTLTISGDNRRVILNGRSRVVSKSLLENIEPRSRAILCVLDDWQSKCGPNTSVLLSATGQGTNWLIGIQSATLSTDGINVEVGSERIYVVQSAKIIERVKTW